MAEYKYLDLAGLQHYDEKLKAHIDSKDAENLAAAKKHAEDLGVNYDPAGTAATKVQELADGQVKANKEAIGTMDNLETTNKNDLVTAINEVRNAVSAGGTAAAISIDTTTTTEGALKSYTIKQGDNVVGTIDIPKDMVVQSGEVVTLAEGNDANLAAGTYIKLVLANASNDEIYVNVGTLVDIYKAKANATQVQLSIDSSSREISAVIVAESITAAELAADAVTTVKIADGNVTKAKLSTEVQGSLDKADAAAVALAEGGSVDTKIATAKGEAISAAAEDATSKANKALDDAKAYADEKANELKGDIENLGDLAGKDLVSESDLDAELKAKVNASAEANHAHANKDVLDGITAEKVAAWDAAEQNAKDHADDLNDAMNTRVEALEAIDHDHANKAELDKIVEGDKAKWDAAEQNAKDYVDGLNDAMDARVKEVEESIAEGGATALAIADAKKAGTDAQAAVEALEAALVEITTAEIDAMFSA